MSSSVLPLLAGVLALVAVVALLAVVARRADRSRRPKAVRATVPTRAAVPATSVSGQLKAGDAPTFDVVGRLTAYAGAGLLWVDQSLRVRWLDETAAQLTGWARADALGQLVFTVCHLQDEDGRHQATPAERVLTGSRAIGQRFAGWLLRRDGQRVPVEVMAVEFSRGSEMAALMSVLPTAERRRAQQALLQRTQLAESIIHELADSVLVTDDSGQVRSANARALRMFGYSAAEITQLTVPRLMPVPFMNAPDVKFSEYRDIPSRRLPRVVAWRRDATHFPAELVVEPLPTQANQSGGGYVVLVRDVSERLRSVNLAQRLGRLLDNAAEEVYIFDAYTLSFVEANRGALRNLGYSMPDMLRLSPLMISEGLSLETFQGYLSRLRGGDVDHLSYRARHRRADGSIYPVEVRLNFSRDEEPPVFMAIAADISEREAEEQALERLAHFDTLTGLPNRSQLMLRMRMAMTAARGGPRQLAVMFVDLDGFKQVNDAHGHEAGDDVLRQIAGRLRDALRASDIVARLSGDEFVVLADGINETADAELVARKLLDGLAPPVQYGVHALPLTASIGITLYPRDDVDAQALLAHADAAMYRAKRRGGGTYAFHGARDEDDAAA